MYKTIGVLAHVDAVKTTFSEQLLFHTKSIKEVGVADHKNAYLENHSIEKETLIDTPGTSIFLQKWNGQSAKLFLCNDIGNSFFGYRHLNW